MFLRSKVQEMILRRRRSRSMNGAGAQRSHASDQLATSSTVPRDNGNNTSSGGDSKSATARALFAAASPKLSHSSSLPAGSVFGKNQAEPETAFSMSPTSVLDAASTDAAAGKQQRRPWREAAVLHGLADALDCADEQQERGVLAATSPSLLLRSCSLDRRVEFGVKNKSSWLPLIRGEAAAAAAPEPAGEEAEMEPSSEDYTCVICRGPNPRTVHIFGDRVVESSPRPINLPPARGEEAFLSL